MENSRLRNHYKKLSRGIWSQVGMAQLVLGILRASTALNFSRMGELNYTTAEAGNPFIEGWYADPDTEIYDGKYWVFPTASDAYEKQTYLDAFSSRDLINWTKHPNVLTVANVTWATKAVWAPAPISRDGKYYLYFGANDIQEDEDEAGMIGGIGVAVADKPEGPYVDAIGSPLIGHYHNGAQPIDQDVFIDEADGQAYIYYGGHGHANVAKLNKDMISIGNFSNGNSSTQFLEITPENYVEGSQMIQRGGKYYFMWSEGGWQGPDYSVSYAMSDTPLGPFKRLAKILQQDSAVAKGSGHHGVINIPGTDIWYIVYHRRPLSETDGNHRVIAYDRMYFNDDGTIAPVHMLVKDNFADGKMIAWKTYGGNWSVLDKRLTITTLDGGIAMLDTNFSNLVFDATVAYTRTSTAGGFAGLVFRATELTNTSNVFKGYFAGVSPSGRAALFIGVSNGTRSLGEADIEVGAHHEHQLRVTAVGDLINVFVDDMNIPKLTVTDATYATGADGVRAFGTTAQFGSISVARAD